MDRLRCHNGAQPPDSLCDELKDLFLLGKSGLFSSQLHEGDLLFQAGRHDIIVIDCGTNDLADNIPIKDIANNVLLFARRCLEEGATIVAILSVLPRTRRIKTSSHEFRENIKTLNDTLAKKCRDEHSLTFG